ADADVILPVPLYRSRLWSRRFNQSAMLAQAVGHLTGVPVYCFLLARVKRTHAQVGLTAAQRRKNVAGAFRMTAAMGAPRRARLRKHAAVLFRMRGGRGGLGKTRVLASAVVHPPGPPEGPAA